MISGSAGGGGGSSKIEGIASGAVGAASTGGNVGEFGVAVGVTIIVFTDATSGVSHTQNR